MSDNLREYTYVPPGSGIVYITISQDRHRASQDRHREGCKRRGGPLRGGDSGVRNHTPVHQNQLALEKWLQSSGLCVFLIVLLESVGARGCWS